MMIKIQIKTGEIARVQLFDFLDFEMRKYHSAFGLVGVGQRIETLGEQTLVADFLWAQGCELLPSHSPRQLDPDTFLQWFVALHHHSAHRPIAQVVAFDEEIRLTL